jgi:hypothetical protein
VSHDGYDGDKPPIRPKVSVTCDAEGCTAAIEAYGDTFAEADAKLRTMLADAGWRAERLEESFHEASRRMGEMVATMPISELANTRISVKRNDRCPACLAKEPS